MKKKLLSIILSVVMCLTMLPSMSFVSNAMESGGDSIIAVEEKVPDEFKNENIPIGDTDKNPFLIVENNELLLFEGRTGKASAGIFDTYTEGESMNLRVDGLNKAGWGSGTSVNPIADDKGDQTTYAYMESVAFDPNGTGRKDHVAFVGYRDSTVWVWVLNTKTGKYGNAYSFRGPYPSDSGGRLNSWLTTNGGINEFKAIDFFSITAGDYDGNGKDSVVVYAPLRSMTLAEFSCGDDSTGTPKEPVRKAGSTSLLHEKFVPIHYENYYSSKDKKYDDVPKNQLSASLTTGDFNGDGIDDLAVLSYTHGFDGNSYLGKANDYLLAIPQLSVKYGKKDSFSISNNDNTVKRYISGSKKEEEKDKFTYETMRSPTITAGDFDNDGIDELGMAGYYEKAYWKGTESKVTDAGRSDVTANTFTFVCANLVGNEMSFSLTTNETNGWTKGEGSWGDDKSIIVRMKAQSFSPNGDNAADYLFINGTIYRVIDGELGAIYTPKYFNEHHNDAKGILVARNFILSAAAGNFDGNEAGREQIVYMVALEEKTEGQDDYFLFPGIVYGINYNDKDNPDGTVNYGTTEEFAFKNDGGYLIGDHGAGDNHDENLNGVVVAVDSDDDGVLGRFKSKEYTYTDPFVAAVLQAAPYFKELDNAGAYDGSGQTTYTTTVTYGKGSSEGDSVSVGVGVSTEVSGTIFGIAKVTASLSLGYCYDWNQKFEESVETSYSTSFAAGYYDQVIVQRIPVIVYNYEVWNPDEKKWMNDGLGVSVPGEPLYYQLSIDEYNSFVDDYNNILKEASDKNDKNEKDIITLRKIQEGNDVDKDIAKDNEGNVYNYWQDGFEYHNGGKSLSQNPLTLSYSGGSSTNDWSYSESSTKSVEESHGFSFELSVKKAIEVGNPGATVEVSLGGYASLQYLHTKGSYTTTTKAKGASGTVQNINAGKLLAKGISSSTINSYGFKWEFGFWERNLMINDTDATPFFGYIVENLSFAAPPPEELTAEVSILDSRHSIDLTWESVEYIKPQNSEHEIKIKGYNLYYVKNGEYKKINSNVLTENKCTVSGLDSNTNYEFVVTTVFDNNPNGSAVICESLISQSAQCKTEKETFTVDLEYDKEKVNIEAFQIGNSDIKGGDEAEEANVVDISYSPKSGYTITNVILEVTDKNGGGKTEIPILADDNKFNFKLTGNSKIRILARKIISDSVVTFSRTPEAGGKIKAAVKGVEISSPGGKITSMPVEFTAEPEKGYVIKEWIIDEGKNDETVVDAKASNTYSFYPYKDSHTVKAVFSLQKDMMKTVVVQSASGGSIEIKNGDETLVPDSKNCIKVVRGTELTITEKPNKYCYFQGWTGNFEGYKNDETTIITEVLDDMTIGAEFDSPVQYKVEYEIENGVGGTLKSVENVASGKYCLPGAEMNFKAEASTGYRFSYWTVVEGDKSTDTSKLTTYEKEKNYKIDSLSSNTKLIAHFTPLECGELVISDEDSNFGVVSSNGKTLKNGDKIYFDDKLKIMPKKGYKVLDNFSNYSDWDVVDGTDGFSYTVPITIGNKFEVNFGAISKYNLVLTKEFIDNDGIHDVSHGSIEAEITRNNIEDQNIEDYENTVSDSNIFYEGSDINVSVKPDEGYMLKIYEWTIGSEKGKGKTLPELKNLNSDVSINVRFSEAGNSITFAPTDVSNKGGHISEAMADASNVINNADGLKIKNGVKLTLTAKPDVGYEVKNWTINGEPVEGSEGQNTFAFDAEADSNDDIEVNFQQIEYGVTTSCYKGTIDVSPALTGGKARGGEELTFTVNCDEGNTVKNWSVNGLDVEGVTGNSFIWTVPNGAAEKVAVKNYVIKANTIRDNTYLLSYSNPEGGTLAATEDSGEYLDNGTEVTFNVTPDTGWHVAGWKLNGRNVETTENEYVLNINSDSVVEAVLEKDKFAVNYKVSGALGKIFASCEGKSIYNGAKVSYGSDVKFTVVPEGKNIINKWTINEVVSDGMYMTSENDAPLTYTIENITSDRNVDVELIKCPSYKVTVVNQVNGSVTPEEVNVDRNGSVELKAVPDEYYSFDYWVIDGKEDKTSTADLKLENIKSDISVQAINKGVIYFDVTFDSVPANDNDKTSVDIKANGKTIYPTATKASSVLGGTKMEFVASHDDKYMVDSWTVNGKKQDELSNTFTIDRLKGKSDVVLSMREYKGYKIPEKPAEEKGYYIKDVVRVPSDTVPSTEIRENGNLTFTVALTDGFDFIGKLAINGYDCLNDRGTISGADNIKIVSNSDKSITVTIENVTSDISAEIKAYKFVETNIEDSKKDSLESEVKILEKQQSVEFVGTNYTDISLKDCDGKDVKVDNSGINLLIPYPEGTDSSYDFSVIHLIENGEKAGTAEILETKNRPDGIEVFVTNLSPFVITWTEKEEAVVDDGNKDKEKKQGGSGVVIRDEKTPADSDEKSVKCDMGSDCPLSAFYDTVSSEWYHDGIHYCIEKKLMNGTSDVTFEPLGSITRSMITTILYRQAGSPEVSGESTFADVSEGMWYTDAIKWAASCGVVNGITETEFAPDMPITREQMSAMMYRYANIVKPDDLILEQKLSDFSDSESVSDWAKESINWCIVYGLINGIDNQLKPAESARRAQAATIFMRLCENVIKYAK